MDTKKHTARHYWEMIMDQDNTQQFQRNPYGEQPKEGSSVRNATTESSSFAQMWETRPVRLPRQDKSKPEIGGVCEGIGVRYDVDPTLIRVAFVVGALMGGGVVLYLLCWMFMPKYGVEKAPFQVAFENIDKNAPGSKALKKEQEAAWWLIAGIVFFTGGLSFGTEGFFGGGMAGALILAGLAWWGLARRTPHPPQGLHAGAQSNSTRPVDLSAYAPAEGTEAPFQMPTPPAWDPLGTAPSLWHLPEPGPAPATPPQTTRKSVASKIAVVLASCILIAGGIFAVNWFGWVNASDAGDLKMAPTTAAALPDRIDHKAGTVELDLRGLAPLDEPKEMIVDLKVGQVDIDLPRDVPVEIECFTRLGEANCPAGIVNAGAEGETLNLTIMVAIGEANADV